MIGRTFFGRFLFALGCGLALAPGFFLAVALELFGELLLLLFVAKLDGLLRPLLGRLEVARLGVGGGQRAEDVGHLVVGQLAGLRGQLDRTLPVSQLVVGRGGQHPREVIQESGAIR